jgi:ATP-dependent helicase/nuclease subunit B
MAVQFILGRSGSGKTGYCLKAIVEALLSSSDKRSLIFLVPEQATYQAERAILGDKRITGYNRLHVLSFDRLQFLLLGKNTARPQLSRIGQQMIVHRVLRANKNKLELFGPSANWPGLARHIANTIAEMHQYAKTPEDIDQLLNDLRKDQHNSLSILKFADIGLVLKEYLNFIGGKFLDPDIQLTRARQAVPQAALVKDARLWVDGFAGFTVSELSILAELLKVAADAQIALCLDPSEIDLAHPDAAMLDETSMFYPTQLSYAALVEIIKKQKLSLAKPIILKDTRRFSSCPQLAYMERYIFTTKPAKIPSANNIRIISSPNERAEVQYVARQIIELVKEKNYRYRDIAVIASDIERYEHYVRAYFSDYGLPFFIDKRKPLNQHPVVQLICSALKAVTGGFSNDDIFAYLKTDLVPLNRFEIDLLENYCLAFGINAGDWQSDKEWHFAGPRMPLSGAGENSEDSGEQQINQIRVKAIGPLLKLKNRFYQGDNLPKEISPEDFIRVIFDFLDALDVRRTVGGWIEQAAQQKDYTAVDEHRQFYDSLVNVFDELVEVFAGQAMSAEDYFAIINSAFSQLALAFIPPTLDQVLVGSIERSRHPDLKAVFLIGATQRQFPTPVVFDSILTDDDRRAAESVDFPLSATAGQKLAERQYLAYIAFTRPSELLYITYPAVDQDGSAIPRSQFIDELESLFEDLKEESIADNQVDIERISNRAELVDFLCSHLGRDSPVSILDSRFSMLVEYIVSSIEYRNLGSTVLSALNYENLAQLDKSVVEELFGKRIKGSATRLSDFAKCPYKHFAGHILELEERKEFKFEPLDVGIFYHNILDAWLKAINECNKDFAKISDEELLRILREKIAQLVQTHPFVSNFARRSAHNTFIINSAAEVLEDCVLAIAQMVRAGSFRPAMSEIGFGQVEDTRDRLGKYELMLSGNRVLSLDGKIDRLDIADIAGLKIAIIFDYKRRGESFGWTDLYYGLDMQLPIYILAVRNAGSLKIKDAIGAFYMSVEAKIEQVSLDKLPNKAEKFTRKANGIFNGDFFQQLDNKTTNKFYNFFVTKEGNQYGRDNISGALRPDSFEKILSITERKIIKLVEEIISGKIDVRPYRINNESPCSYCKFRAVCRFDWQINDYNSLVSLGKSEVLEKIGAAGG